MSSARPAKINIKDHNSSAQMLATLNSQAIRKNPLCEDSLHSSVDYELKVLYTEAEIHLHLDQLAAQLNQSAVFHSTEGPVPLFLTVQLGAAISSSYVQTKLDFMVELDNIQTSRYEGNTIGGELKLHVKPKASLENRPIIIYDDIIDLAITAGKIIDFLVANGADANLIYLAVMLDKTRPRDPNFQIHPDFSAIKIADQFIVGYGLDYTEGLGRDLPWLGVLVKKEAEVIKRKQEKPESFSFAIGSRYMLLKNQQPKPEQPEQKKVVVSHPRFYGCG